MEEDGLALCAVSPCDSETNPKRTRRGGTRAISGRFLKWTERHASCLAFGMRPRRKLYRRSSLTRSVSQSTKAWIPG